MTRRTLTPNYRSDQLHANSYGTTILDWNSGATYSVSGTGTSGAINNTEVNPDDGVKSAYIPYNASHDAYCQAILTSPYPFQDLKSIVFWAYLPEGTSHATIRAYFSADNNDFTNTYILDFLVNKPGWNLYGTVLNQASSGQQPRKAGTITWATDSLTTIRFRDQSAESTVFGYAPMVSGDSCRIGTVYVNYRSRPKFIIHFDDARDNLYSNPAASGKTVFSIINSYGWNASVYSITGVAGTGDYETLATLKTVYDAGWDVCNHTSTLTSTNYVDDVADAAGVAAEFNAARATLIANGMSRGADHHALPAGKHDRKTWDGLGTTTIKSCRSVISKIHALPGIYIAGTNDQNGNENVIYHPQLLNLVGSYPWDTNVDLSTNLEAHVDECISFGSTGTAYGHSLSGWAEANLIALCDHLKLRENQGLIDIVTTSEWYDGL